jgi:phage head maturation protease
LLSQHGSQGKGVGEVTLVRTSKTEVYIQAALNNSAAADYAWALIENGEVRALSVGWNPISVQAEVDKITFYDRWSIREISMVRTGANPDCRFEIFENGATWPFR